MSEDSKILFECDICFDKYNIHLCDLGIDIKDGLCNKCFEKTLIVTNCSLSTRAKLCDNILCKICYNKSLASHYRSQFIDAKLIIEQKLKYARFIKKGTDIKYPWICDEGHQWFSSVKWVVSRSNWCHNVFCRNKKYKATCQEKYGVENTFQVGEFKEKSKVTCREKYGFDYVSQSQKIKDKKIQTCMENFGVNNPSQSQKIKEKVKEKVKATSREKYGVDHPSQSQEFKEKSKATCREKYRVDNPMQVYEIFKKNQKACYKQKEYTFPSGRKTQVQGYEPIAIDMLLKIYQENDIQTCNEHKLKIKYIMNDVDHFYYPDIFIISENLIIEVKSKYTYFLDEDKNLIKAEACLKYGYKFKFIILDKNKNLIDHHLSF
jgi:hypothetical protein